MDAYVGEIRMFAGTFAPVGWLMCDGSYLQISQFEVLFSLIGTTYGGNGTTIFALPDLRGRVPLGYNPEFALGQQGGAENVALSSGQLPSHSHNAKARNGTGGAPSPNNSYCAGSSLNQFSSATPGNSMSPMSIGSAGNGQQHSNLQPYLVVNFIINYDGYYPPRD